VRALDSARLLLSSRRRGPGYRNGDEGGASALAGGRVLRHEADPAPAAGRTSAIVAKQPWAPAAPDASNAANAIAAMRAGEKAKAIVTKASASANSAACDRTSRCRRAKQER
jgi:hypothetical protein